MWALHWLSELRGGEAWRVIAVVRHQAAQPHAKAEAEGAVRALTFADQTFVAFKTTRPVWFVKNPRDSSLVVAPLLEARAAVEQAKSRLAP